MAKQELPSAFPLNWPQLRPRTTSNERYTSRFRVDYHVAKELARTVLPLGTYTEWFWQNDLHNTLHFLKLRLDPHAQYEIRVYAEAMLELLKPIYPTIIAAWEETR